MASSFCTTCGTPFTEGMKFCASCGTALPRNAPPPEPMRPPTPVCPACGAPVREESKFCMECGATLNPEAPPPIPAQPYQAPAPPVEPRKKRRSPLIWVIPLGIVVLIGIIVAVALLIGNSALNAARSADYFEIGDDKIPSVLLALGEEREMTGISLSASGNVRKQQYTYRVLTGQNRDMLQYATYLEEAEGFQYSTNADFNKSTGEAIQLMRTAEEDGYLLVVQLDYDADGYTVTVMRGEGMLEPNAETPEVTETPPTPTLAVPTATTEPDSTPVNNIVPEVGTEPYYELGGNKIPTVYHATGIKRDVSFFKDEANAVANARYDMTDSSAILSDIIAYDAYLTEQDGWIRVVDTNYGQSSGTVQFGKPATEEGMVVIVQVDWNEQGYMVTVAILEGTLTTN